MSDIASADEPVRLGTLLHEIGREAEIGPDEIAILESIRDHAPAREITFDD